MSQISVELCSWWGGDRDIAYSAWASTYDKERLAAKSDDDVRRVVSSIISNDHQTPKERIWLDFFITCPIFVERQLDKYRISLQFQDMRIECERGDLGRWGITQNELSGRYRTIPERPYGLPWDVARILEKSSPTESEDHDAAADIKNAYDTMVKAQHESYQAALKFLKDAEKAGRVTNTEYKRAREVLRGELGTAYMTDMRWVLNLGAFEHVINQRLAPEAQMESRVVAHKMLQAVWNAGVASTTVNKMVEVNGWEAWGQEVQKWIEENEDVPYMPGG